MKLITINLEKFNAAMVAKPGDPARNQVVASGVDHLDRWVNLFVSTDKETGAIRTTKKGDVILNVRAQRAREESQSPGQVLKAPADTHTNVGGTDADLVAQVEAAFSDEGII